MEFEGQLPINLAAKFAGLISLLLFYYCRRFRAALKVRKFRRHTVRRKSAPFLHPRGCSANWD